MKAIKALQQALLGLVMPAVLLCVGIAFLDQAANLHMFKYRTPAMVSRDNQVADLASSTKAPAPMANASGLVPPPPPFPFNLIR